MHDLLIRGATLVDGTGAPARTADLAVADGRIAAIGAVTGAAKRTVDADGLVLAPGIIDIHTHYDAQVTWDPTLSPSPAPMKASAATKKPTTPTDLPRTECLDWNPAVAM